MTPEETNRRIDEAFENPRMIQDALAKGVADARRQYAQAGLPMVDWKDGKVIWIDPVTLQEVERPGSLPVRQTGSSN